MQLSELFRYIEHKMSGCDVDISGIEYDSRKACDGKIFCCIVGNAMDGHKFAAQAVENGATALLVQRQIDIDIPQIIVENSREAMASAALAFYDFPARKLKMVGVTGTNGKTTSTYMIKSIAEKAGYKVGLIGTITNLIGDSKIEAEHTTPESVDLQKLLRRMVDEKVDICVMEVSSHSLEQGRVFGIEFDVALFTNLTQDHLDYHKTMESYREAKKKLFVQSKYAVINVDDLSAREMVKGLEYPVLTFGVRVNSDIYAKEIEVTTDGSQFSMKVEKNLFLPINVNISGVFSVYNALGSAAVAIAIGIDYESIKRGISSLNSVSGRLEKLQSGSRGYSVYLDYAHTPDALENVISACRGFAKARIITLFGCGGDRDKAKRPIMGETAGRYSDFCIITSDNPRNEDPLEIIKSIEEGMIKSGCDYKIIESRREAIKYVLSIGQNDDIIILAGKGHETYQDVRGAKAHFDEKEIVSELLKEI